MAHFLTHETTCAPANWNWDAHFLKAFVDAPFYQPAAGFEAEAEAQAEADMDKLARDMLNEVLEEECSDDDGPLVEYEQCHDEGAPAERGHCHEDALLQHCCNFAFRFEPSVFYKRGAGDPLAMAELTFTIVLGDAVVDYQMEQLCGLYAS